jgi:8-oxo-dGTP diphosphatase / 2-hydroxy-dATP diphosphatase
MKAATIVFCIRDDEVLLGMKKVRFGAGKWNGFGGKVEEGESIDAAALREVKEEAGLSIDPKSINHVAIVSFYFGKKEIFECHAYIAREWEGEPIESDEMLPQWFPLTELPYKEMWPSDLYWLPAVLLGHTLTGMCRFNDEGTVVESFEMRRMLPTQ